jgi:diaminopimelate epimerase
MRIWNHDGGEVQSCGNASRCVVALTGAESLETGGGLVTGAAEGSDVEVGIGTPKFAWDEIPLSYPMDTAAVPMGWGPLEKPMALSVGNPHVVFFVPTRRRRPDRDRTLDRARAGLPRAHQRQRRCDLR